MCVYDCDVLLHSTLTFLVEVEKGGGRPLELLPWGDLKGREVSNQLMAVVSLQLNVYLLQVYVLQSPL